MLEKTGMVLGVVGDQVYRESPPIELGAGDLLFLHTDGVDEAMSPQREVFGGGRLQAVVAKVRAQALGAEDVLKSLDKALKDHVAGAAVEDDYTMIAVKLA